MFRGLLLFTSVFFFFANTALADTKFKVGQKYQNFIQLDNHSKNMQIPLPKGEWTVTAVDVKDPNSRGTILIWVYLMNEIEKNLKGLIRFAYAYENYTSGWLAPHKFCGSNFNLFSKDNGSWNGTQSDCWRIRGITVTTKKEGGGRDSIEYMQNKGIALPVIAPIASYYRFNRSEFYIAEYIRNPEIYGIPKVENEGSGQTNDYAPDRIAEYPKKKAFIDKFVAWGKEWKKYVDLGFEGKLTAEMMGKSIVTKAEKPKSSGATHGVEAKLKKLKDLVDKGLITSEDAAAKRKEILGSM